MSAAQPGPIRVFFRSIFKAINFTNHLVFNILMLFIVTLVIVIIAAGLSAKSFEPLRDKTALVLNLDGHLVEQASVDTLSTALARAQGEGTHEIQLRDIIAALAEAKIDPKISYLFINTEGLDVDGMASLREVAKALQDFKTSGKPVYAFATNYDQKQYLLAAQADNVFMDPEGALMFDGLGRYRLYYRQALQEKLGIDVHLFRVGEYKSAAEPYILDAASKESKQADLFWMTDIWQRYIADIAKARKLDVGALNAAITEMPARVEALKGDMAQWAVNEKWIDGLKTSYEMEQFLISKGVADRNQPYTFQQIDLDAYLGHLKNRKISQPHAENKIAIVVAQGEIVDGEQGPGMVGGDSTAALIRQAREDDQVKAVVLRVDSPGGSVFASEQIRREVVLTKAAGKPVVVSMANVAASGGYWIAMNADKIYADASTVTGSIGIFGLMMRAPKALEKIGMHSDGVGTTPWTGTFDWTRPMDATTAQLMQTLINRGYQQFVSKVAKARKQTYQQIDANARGRVWSGAQAYERGLIDATGGLLEATAEAAKRANLSNGNYSIWYVEKDLSAFEQFVSNLSRNSSTQGLVNTFSPAIGLLAQLPVGHQVSKDMVWLVQHSNKPYQSIAHCLCEF